MNPQYGEVLYAPYAEGSTYIIKTKRDDVVYTDEVVSDEYAAERVGVSQDMPYTDITSLEYFMMYFEDFRDPDNPLQLPAGTFDDAVIISPIKICLLQWRRLC